jgi:mannose-6-phosphate isomerase-like protein (cupin superfamily)
MSLLANLSSNQDKSVIFLEVRKYLESNGFNISGFDDNRPWGGFFYVDESQAELFIQTYFPHLSLTDFSGFSKLSPKILLVAPNQRLSWQYHHRRSEIWKLIAGQAAIVISDTDELTPQRDLAIGEVVNLQKGERHRLVGTNGWGIIAEIWQHTDPENPSDEGDIVRVQDDFGR